VAEADESDGSFLALAPEIAVVTNVDREHLDHFGSYAALHEAFRSFAGRTRRLVVLCSVDGGARALAEGLPAEVVMYGTDPGAAWSARRFRLEGPVTRFEVMRSGRLLGDVTLPLVGGHYALNAVAALAVAEAAGIEPEKAIHLLPSFGGVERRFTIRGEAGGVVVADDYGHHPAEIRATLGAAKEAFGRRLLVAFQPHRYTRTRDLIDDFAAAFELADELIVTPIYGAGEDPIPGVDSGLLARAIAHRRNVVHLPRLDDVIPWILAASRPGDLVLLQGAGDINRLGPRLLGLFKRNSEKGAE
jgi:UDP-N-acetylmuramate--alanine ligase